MSLGTPTSRYSTIRRAGALAMEAPRPPVLVAVVCLALITLFAITGFLARLDVAAAQWFELDAELRGAAVFSALLLLAAGTSTVGVWRRDRSGRAVLPVGVLLCFMAVDEVTALHETLEATTGVDWQVLYLPAFAVAGVCFLLALRRYWAIPAFRGTWVLGAVCWVVSQVLEFLQWDGDVQRTGYSAMMIPEELLEMLGSASFLVAMLVVVAAMRERHPDPGVRADGNGRLNSPAP
ncbi:hypothetical protein F1C76_12210 [Geodermatophilaceae bacterium NBWT11]|nr:hypothetical protein F1C76_12210 [Geodermatophilaceae bacterium NBWT11]